MDKFECNLDPSSINDLYANMRAQKTELGHFILDEIKRVNIYLNELTEISIFECAECGAELTYCEYNAWDGLCHRCRGC